MTKRVATTRRVAVVLAALMLLGSFAGSAMSQDFTEHPHMLVLGLELDADEEPIGFRKCIDLANNQALRLNAHHAHLHFGQAGEAQWQAGNVIVPGAPFPAPFADPLPWSNCAELISFFFE